MTHRVYVKRLVHVGTGAVQLTAEDNSEYIGRQEALGLNWPDYGGGWWLPRCGEPAT